MCRYKTGGSAQDKGVKTGILCKGGAGMDKDQKPKSCEEETEEELLTERRG